MKSSITLLFLLFFFKIFSGETSRDVTDYRKFPGKDIPSSSPFLIAEFCTEAEYFDQLLHKEDCITEDSSIQKKGSQIILPCKDTLVIFKDISDEEDASTYEYAGKAEHLNAYVIYGEHYEWVTYTLIDQITGKTLEFEEYPYLIPGEKHILVISNDPFKGYTDLNLFSYDNGEIIHSLSLEGWLPAWEREMYRSKNNYFYLPLLKVENQVPDWDSQNYSYLKINILNNSSSGSDTIDFNGPVSLFNRQ